VRDAYEAAKPGALLDRVFRQALGVGKRVRSETAIGESPARSPRPRARLPHRSSATSVAGVSC